MGAEPRSWRDLLSSSTSFNIVAFLGGAMLPLSLSPIDFWPLALLSPALLFFVTRTGTTRQATLRFYLYNVALFGVGASWIFVSVHEYGNASVLFAGFLVLLLVLVYSLVCVPQAILYARYFRSSMLTGVFGFSALWVIQECFRTWFLTGFPWLFAGYGVMGTPIENIAPVTGVYGVSLAAVLIATSLVAAAVYRSWAVLVLAVTVVTGCLLLGVITFTQHERMVSVSLVQGNINQHVKWHPANRQPIIERYRNASESEWGRDLIIWPEAALTLFRDQASIVLEQLDQKAETSGSALILGIPDRDLDGGFQNTVIILGRDKGQYIKRRLVPFGEYVPLENYLRGMIELFDLPMSRNNPGPAEQATLVAGGNRLSISICYEVVYPDLVRTSAESPDLLVTVSNDTWFGSSIGPWQHFQMARMRALENGRAMIRATNNGVTALVDHRGLVKASLPQFKTGILRGDVEVRTGSTPFSDLGSYPVIIACLFMLAFAFYTRDQR